MTKRADILKTDNRDLTTTWLWTDNHKFIEVNPWDLVKNALENHHDTPVTTLALTVIERLEHYLAIQDKGDDDVGDIYDNMVEFLKTVI